MNIKAQPNMTSFNNNNKNKPNNQINMGQSGLGQGGLGGLGQNLGIGQNIMGNQQSYNHLMGLGGGAHTGQGYAQGANAQGGGVAQMTNNIPGAIQGNTAQQLNQGQNQHQLQGQNQNANQINTPNLQAQKKDNSFTHGLMNMQDNFNNKDDKSKLNSIMGGQMGLNQMHNQGQNLNQTNVMQQQGNFNIAQSQQQPSVNHNSNQN